MDFSIPVGWFAGMPCRGVLSLNYCRSKEVMFAVLQHGAYKPGTGVWQVPSAKRNAEKNTFAEPFVRAW